jgi:hypothetical protein
MVRQKTPGIPFSILIVFLWMSYAGNELKKEGNSVNENVNVILLHHSTGGCIWRGGVPAWFDAYNAEKNTQYQIAEQPFPKKEPYGWRNYPYDYWNIWVKNGGPEPYLGEPTLEMLTSKYQVIIFKHCFPVSKVAEDIGAADIESNDKRAENYKLQYNALKEKMRSFPDNKFIVWTGAALVESKTDEPQAKRAREFFSWVKKEWDEPGDNIFLWDFDTLQTEGGLYFKKEYARGENDSHPGQAFSQKAAGLLCNRIVNVIEGRGDASSLTGE